MERWILARLRNRRFFSLGELNEAIAELLDELNRRPFQKLEGCRRSAYEELYATDFEGWSEHHGYTVPSPMTQPELGRTFTWSSVAPNPALDDALFARD